MSSSSPLSTDFSNENSPPVLTQVNPKALHPHPSNSSIYGEDDDVTELVELIAQSGWVKPLVVTPSKRIISGHRRWKAALQLELESVPVEVREFRDELAELEALLLENASRFKTIEQKVREASAWKEVEASKASVRQILLAGTRPNTQPDLQANLPEGEKGQTRERIAHRVGLRARNYEKAAFVVEIIDKQKALGNSSHAQVLRRVLNEQSVDAAYQIVKKPTESRAKILALLASGQAKTTKEAIALVQQQYGKHQGGHSANQHSTGVEPSCWNCQHRGELIENNSFYCYRLGVLSLLEKSADTRGTECDLWSYFEGDSEEATNFTHPSHSTFTITLTLPAHLQPLIQDAAETKGMSVVDWATVLLESEALATCTDPSRTTKAPESK